MTIIYTNLRYIFSMRICNIVTLILCLFYSPNFLAGEFFLYAGGAYTETKATVDSEEDQSDITQTFELDKIRANIQPFIGLDYYFKRRLHLATEWRRFTYQREYSSSTTILTDDIKTDFDLRLFKVAAGYDLWREYDNHLTIYLGIHQLHYEQSINIVEKTDVNADVLKARTNASLVLHAKISTLWEVRSTLNYYDIDPDSMNDAMFDFDFSTYYPIYSDFYVGVGYYYASIRTEQTSVNRNNAIEQEFFGPSFSVYYYF